MSRPKQSYDHRLRDLVRSSRDITIATAMGIPASTARGWLRASDRNTITTDTLTMNDDDLRTEVLRLRRRIQKLRAVIGLLVAVLRALDVDLARRRIPDGAGKSLILAAVERARVVLKCRVALAVIDLSATRLHAWKRAERSCDLDDHSSCPKSSPHRLTADEIQTMKEMTTSTQYRHVPTGNLSLLAQRTGRVFASGSTWRRFVRERGWRRPRLRLHPAKPRVGIRANEPDEIWHIDTTLIRMVDGSKAYLHGLIDNYSRRILAWHVSEKFETTSTVTVLLDAIGSRASNDGSPEVLADGGGENVNGKVGS